MAQLSQARLAEQSLAQVAHTVSRLFLGIVEAGHREMMLLLERSDPLTLPIQERRLADANAAVQDLQAGRIVGRVVLNASAETTSAL